MNNGQIVVRRSGIHGRGLFALCEFAPGEVVLRWNTSKLITREEQSLLPEEERKYTHPFDDKHIMLVQPPERFVNHSCNNNTVVRDFCDIAIKPIAIGDEITSDYGLDGSGVSFKCLCGSENCRGVVGETE